MTDAKGRFIFTRLPAGTNYSLNVSAPGYLDGGFNRKPGALTGPRLLLEDAQWLQDADVALWKPAAVSGIVRDERGDPLVGIPVRLLKGIRPGGRRHWASGPIVTTDDRGHYRIAGLLPGDYVVHVPSVQISLPSGEIRLYRAPMRGASTGAPSSADAAPSLKIIRRPDGSGLVAGYPTPRDTAGSVYPPTFHPAAASVDQAIPIRLEFGDDRTDVDVQLIPRPAVAVSGQVIGPPEAVAGIIVRLVAAGNESLGLGGETGLAKADARGGFVFPVVPEGTFTIVASRSVSEYQMSGGFSRASLLPPGSNPFINRISNSRIPGDEAINFNTAAMSGTDIDARVLVSVGREPLSDVIVATTPTVTVSGSFLWDGSEAPPDVPALAASVRLEPADGDLSKGQYFSRLVRPADAGATPMTFSIQNVKPGRYWVSTLMGVVGATWNGRDLFEMPLEVTGDAPITGVVVELSTTPLIIKGTVHDEDGTPAESGAVLLFPDRPDAWRDIGVSGGRFKTASIGGDGTFQFIGIARGSYLMVAVPASDAGRGTDPDYLAGVAGRAVRVQIATGSTVIQDLRLSGGRP
jgi:hypothetical protein